MSYTGTYHRLGLAVWASDRAVIRALLHRVLKPAAWRGPCARQYRKGRHAIIREVLAAHHAAQKLCREFRL